MKLEKISRQVVVVTGASSRIGRATARLCAARGARVVLMARDARKLEHAVQAIRAARGSATHVVGDVIDLTHVARAADTAVEMYGRIDTWVNAAEISLHGSLVDVTIEQARRMFDVNYWGVVHGSLVAVKFMRERGGAIINLGGSASESAAPFAGHGCASKHAVKGFTETLRAELRRAGVPISVTLLEPRIVARDVSRPISLVSRKGSAAPSRILAPDAVAREVVGCADGGRTWGALGRRLLGARMLEGAMNVGAALSGRARD